MRTLHSLSNPLPFGPITSLCIDRKRVWLVAGTASGTLTLWDLRFGLLLRSWTVGARRIHKVAVHPGKEKANGRWVVVAIEDSGAEEKMSALVAEVWDVERGIKVEEFRVVGPGTASRASFAQEPSQTMKDAILNPASAIEALLAAAAPPKARTRLVEPAEQLQAQKKSRPGVRAFLVGVDYPLQGDQRYRGQAEEREGKEDKGYLITGGEDRKVRFWDLGRTERSAVVSGLEMDDERPVFTCVSLLPSSSEADSSQCAYQYCPPYSSPRIPSRLALPSTAERGEQGPSLDVDCEFAAAAAEGASGGDHGARGGGSAV